MVIEASLDLKLRWGKSPKYTYDLVMFQGFNELEMIQNIL